MVIYEKRLALCLISIEIFYQTNLALHLVSIESKLLEKADLMSGLY